MFAQPSPRMAPYSEAFLGAANELEEHNGPVHQRLPCRFSDLLLITNFPVRHPHAELIGFLRRGTYALILVPAVGTWPSLVIHRAATIAVPRARGCLGRGMG